MTTNEQVVALHPWEKAGLGKAPFKFLGVEERRGPYRPIDPKTGQWDGMTEIGSPGQPMGTCDYCGQGIAFCCRVLSHDGKQFIVGCDCIARINQEPKMAIAARKIVNHLNAKSKVGKRTREAFNTYRNLTELLRSDNVINRYEAGVAQNMRERFQKTGKITERQIEWLRRMVRR